MVELVDTEEEETSLIAMMVEDVGGGSRRFTHAEIHPSLILGVCASIIPFCDHNQVPSPTFPL
jgi:DNA-directed RNA polymerase II subunit RPB2